MPACTVLFHSGYEREFDQLDVKIRKRLAAYFCLLAEQGVALGEPYSKPIEGSNEALRELRPQIGGRPWRVLYQFDPRRNAVLLVGGDKGSKGNRWYDEAIPIAERRIAEYRRTLEDG